MDIRYKKFPFLLVRLQTCIRCGLFLGIKDGQFPFLLVRLQTQEGRLGQGPVEVVSIPFSQAANTMTFRRPRASLRCFHSFQLGCKHTHTKLSKKILLLVSIPFSQAANTSTIPPFLYSFLCFHSFQLGCKRERFFVLGHGRGMFPFLLVRLQTDKGKIRIRGLGLVSIPFSQAANCRRCCIVKANKISFHSFQLGCKHLFIDYLFLLCSKFPFLLVRLQTLREILEAFGGWEVSIPFSQAANTPAARPFHKSNFCFHSFQLGCKPSGRLPSPPIT